MDRLRPVFTKLERMHLTSCNFNKDIENAFPICTHLKDLHVVSENWKKIPIEIGILYNLIATNNKTLTNLFIYAPPTFSTEILQIIGQNLQKLTSLSFTIRFKNLSEFQTNIQCLSNLLNLTEFSMNFCFQDASPLCQSFVSKYVKIQKLNIREAILTSDGIDSICQLKELTKLIWGLHLRKNHLIELVKRLPILDTIELAECSTRADLVTLKKMLSYGKKLKCLSIRMEPHTKFDVQEYQTILQIILSRPVKTQMHLRLIGGTFDVPENIRSQNEDWLSIYWNDTQFHLPLHLAEHNIHFD